MRCNDQRWRIGNVVGGAVAVAEAVVVVVVVAVAEVVVVVVVVVVTIAVSEAAPAALSFRGCFAEAVQEISIKALAKAPSSNLT